MKQLLLVAFVLMFSSCVAQNKNNDDVLSYESFLEIYESMAKSGNDDFLPSSDVIQKYGLTKMHNKDPYLGSTTVIGRNFRMDGNIPRQSGDNSWWIGFDNGEDGFRIYLQIDESHYKQFIKSAKEYGLVSLLMWPENDGDSSHECLISAKKAERGKVTLLHSKRDCKEKEVIGLFDIPNDLSYPIELGFNVLESVPETYYSDLISFDDIIKTNGNLFNLIESHGFKSKEVKGGPYSLSYIYKNCIINGERVTPSGNGTPICIQVDGSRLWTMYTIKLFDETAINQMVLEFHKYAHLTDSPNELSYIFNWLDGEECSDVKINYNKDGKGGDICFTITF